MKKLQTLIVAIVTCLFAPAYAQTATLNISIANQSVNNCSLHIPERALLFDAAGKGNTDIPVNNGKAIYRLQLTSPLFADIAINGGINKRYNLYLSPGDSINIVCDDDYRIIVTGKGSENNQPLLGDIITPDPQFYGDTLPTRFIASANEYYNKLKNAFDEYVKLYHPTPDFIKNESENIAYTTLQQYYFFKENNKYQVREAYKRNKNKWQAVQDSLLNLAPLNNGNPVIAMSYALFVCDFMQREKERLWMSTNDNAAAFYKEWYNADTASGKKQFMNDMQNTLSEKIANRYFTGKAQELAYAALIDYAVLESDYINLVAIFDRFSTKFPQSQYIKWYAEKMDTLRQKEKQQLTNDMVFLPGNGANLNSFEDVLAQMKGKTVLVDMWGTWCGPCRLQINENADAMHNYFKNKGVDFLYIANHDSSTPERWKKAIALMGIKGTHLLASEQLTKDIMTKVKGPGYPTYFIIKKDGSWELLSKPGPPPDRDTLIAKLNVALTQ